MPPLNAHEFLLLVERMEPAETRGGLRRLLQEAEANRETNDNTIAMLAFRLVDGLRHGNWPAPPAKCFEPPERDSANPDGTIMANHWQNKDY